MLLSQSKDSNVTKQLSPPSTLLHIYEIMCQNTDNVVANLTRQAGTGDSRINLVSFLFLVCCCYTLGILWVADYSPYPDVCTDTNLSKHKTRDLSIFTVHFSFEFLSYFPVPLDTYKNKEKSSKVWWINI